MHSAQFHKLSVVILTAAAVVLFACGGGGKSDAGTDPGGGLVDSGTGGGTGALECVPACTGGRLCKPATNTCVECLSNSDCTDPAKPLCAIGTDVCGPDTSSGSDGGAPPANDACSGAQAVTVQPGATTVVTTDTSNATDDEESSCGGQGNLDTVFALAIPANQRVAITAVPDSSVDVTLYARSGSCSGGTELACIDVGYEGESELLVLPAGPAQTVYLFVETWDGTDGPVTVNIRASAPVPGDTCDTATAVTLSSGNASFSVETTDFGPDYQSETCHGGTGPDAIYSVNVPANSDFDVRAEPVIAPDGGALDGGELLDLQVDIFQGPCDAPTELTCRDFAYAGKADMASLRGIDAGTYYFAIDGYGGTSGLANVQVQVYPAGPVPANDQCTTDGGLPVLSTTPMAGDTTHAKDHNYWTCGGVAAKDLYYVVPNTPSTGTLVVTVTPTGGGLEPVVTILGGNCTAASEVACTAGYSTGPTLAVTPVDGGTFYVVVDGDRGTQGSFNVSAVVQ